MAPTGESQAETQFRFLLSCIRHSVAGKIDFGAVAEEQEIVSKAAAAKRYERLLKAHDASPKKAPADPADDGAEGTPPKKTPRKRRAAKISKTEPEDEDEEVKDEIRVKKDDSDFDQKAAKKAKGKRKLGSDEPDSPSALGADAVEDEHAI